MVDYFQSVYCDFFQQIFDAIKMYLLFLSYATNNDDDNNYILSTE